LKANACPEKIALRAIRKDIFSMLLTSNCHLSASKPQFTNMRAIINTNFHACGPENAERIINQDV